MAGDYGWFWAKLDKYLEVQKLKQTQQRKKIVEFFLKSKSHIRAEELHALMKKAGMNTGIATIYRTLNLLREAELVEQKSFADGHHVFEIFDPSSHHDHLICVDCKNIIEFHSPKIESLQSQIARRHSFKLSSHHHVLYGHCQKKNCAGKKRK